MKKALILLLQIILALSLYSQHFVSRKWDARFGGIESDQLYAIKQTRDGGYILGGTSYSGVGGNKTQPNWDITLQSADYWIVKTDANGNYLWDKRYGGTSDDFLNAICATSDGGCLLGGYSASLISGDKTQQPWGGWDYWVVKLDSLGNKQWDRDFGGTNDDLLFMVRQTKDGGYVLSGRSNSPISGDKTQDDWGDDDYWIVKIDSAGNKQWDKRFGSINEDKNPDVIQTPDGGYLIGGTSLAYDTSGDKTQMNYAPAASNFWVIKTDSLGNKQWDKVYGGIYGEDFGNSLNTNDGNYILGGTSYDWISGDKTAPFCGYWLVKIDTAGNELGDWAYGSEEITRCPETFGSMTNTSDGGYLLTGIGGTDTGGDKTSGSTINGGSVWTIKIDSQMNRVWDQTAFTTQGESQSSGALQCSASCYLISLPTAAGIGGDKSQPNWDTTDATFDYWMVEFCDSFPLGIQEPVGAMHLLIYPNPTSDDLYINIQKDNLTGASFTLTNTAGQTIYQSTSDHLAHSYTKILDLSRLPTGVYILNVIVDGERIVKKVLKE